MALRERIIHAAYGIVGSPSATAMSERLSAVAGRHILRDLRNDLRIDCVIDVGANRGRYARVLRRLRFSGLILSFEPNPEVFAWMRQASGVSSSVFGLQSEIAMRLLYRGMPDYLEALSFYQSLGFRVVDPWLNNRTEEGYALEYACLMRRPV